ncbi:TonB-dependent receptor [Tamlana sp. 62-3]|uniref:TonB-dependent receptor n=1 Tax=Neotamlana sargassicola TaxID=2883125 RepID=A0A9X1L4E9_9FLAO|nr:TonB-dependent receptor [Tamlana sargassicola]MCB4808117.1 TonB-dependent receptor [Tamlana sargassicola]
MKNILVVICFLINAVVLSQNCEYSLKGEVIDFHNATPIENAAIKVLNTNNYAVSDINGNFTLKNLCNKVITIEVSHISCETQIISIEIKENAFETILLEHHLDELNEVVVNTTIRAENTSISRSLKQKTIDDFTDKSLGDALNTISGVSSLNTGSTIVKPMIHGLHSSRLLIINNNVRLFDQEWGDEHAPNIDINASNSIEVVKGATTLRYGSDAIGGLILVKPKKYATIDSLFGSSTLSFNSNGLGGIVNSELIKTYKSGFYGKIQANYKQFGDFKAPDYYLTNTGTKNLNASVAFGYNSFEKGFDAYYSIVSNEFAILKSSHIGNVNDLVTTINNEEPSIADDFSYTIDYPKQSILHHLAKVEAYKRFKGLGKLTAQYDFQINRRKEYDLRRGDYSDTPVIDLRLFTTSFQPNLLIDAIDDFEINTGFLLRFQQNDAISGTGASPLIPDYEKYDAGVYATANYKMDLFNDISAGVRYDFSRIEAVKWYNTTDWEETYNYDELFPEFESGTTDNSETLTYPEFTFHNFSANLGYTRHFSNDFELFFNYGLASRMPNPSELFSDGLHHSAARIETGKLTIGKEVANKFMFSLQRNSQKFGFTISPYYNAINNYILLIPAGITTTVRGAFPVWEYEQVDARIFGIDIDLDVKLNSKFNYSGSISLLQGDNLTDDIPLIQMPSTNFSNSITYYNKNLNQLSIRLNHKTVLQQKRYPDYNFYTYNATVDDYVYVDISTPPSAYSLFSFNSSANFKAFKTGTLKVEFNVENIFNTSYREYLNRLRYFGDELGRNFNLKIKINY